MDESSSYEDTGTAGQNPLNDASLPDGGGTHSASGDGGNKVDPVSAGPNLGNTIAGRQDVGRPTEPSFHDADPGNRGRTGQTGRELGEGDASSKGAAAADINPGDSETGFQD